MLTRMQYLALTALASVAFVLMVANMVMFSQNRAVQTEVASRQQYIQQALQLQPLYQEMVKALADLAVRRGDDALRELLQAHGITFTPRAETPPPAAPADQKAGRK